MQQEKVCNRLLLFLWKVLSLLWLWNRNRGIYIFFHFFLVGRKIYRDCLDQMRKLGSFLNLFKLLTSPTLSFLICKIRIIVTWRIEIMNLSTTMILSSLFHSQVSWKIVNIAIFILFIHFQSNICCNLFFFTKWGIFLISQEPLTHLTTPTLFKNSGLYFHYHPLPSFFLLCWQLILSFFHFFYPTLNFLTLKMLTF